MTDNMRNLVFTGFMGTGKSSVARAAAATLGRPYVDMDQVIVERAGIAIPDIFRIHGEETFRQYERDVIRDLSGREGLVVATGGGALVDAENLRIMADTCCVICLDCAAEELLERVGGDGGRPMLWGDDPESRLRELLEDRRPAYAEIAYHLDTTGRELDQVVERAIALFASEPRHWAVGTPTGEYDIYLVPDGLVDLGALLSARGIVGRVVVISDENVGPLYSARISSSLERSAYQDAVGLLPAGEQWKNLNTVRELYDRFVEVGLDRSGVVVALGGGVITDMVGFAASTFMRGVALVQVPTTLLGMVDASVGGKVAVDHPKGKNLVGAFVRPLLVMIDPEVLDSLPEIQYRAGMAEVIKAGIIADPQLFSALEPEGTPRDLRWMVERALQVKIDIVEQDPYEHGRRLVLNLGHTFAHAFEVLADYRLHHGLAVSIGMTAAAHLAELRGLCSGETRARIIDTLRYHDLPTQYDDYAARVVHEAMGTDKKRRGSKLRFVLPCTIGDVIVVDGIEPDEVVAALERIRP